MADRDQVAASPRLAALAASMHSDRSALQELVHLFNDLRLWRDALVQDQRDLNLAELYMSPGALNDDTLFQKSATYTAFLPPRLASGRLAEDSSCR